MPRQKLYLDEAKTQLVELQWRGMWKDFTVFYNGQEVGRFADRNELIAGRHFQLPDSAPLHVRLHKGFGSDTGLVIEHNGKPVKGTFGDPETTLKSVFIIAVIIGGLSVLLGALAESGSFESLDRMGAGYPSIIVGLLVGVLGYLTWKKRSALALGAIIGLLVIDICLALMVALEMNSNHFPTTYIGLKVIFILQFARGFRAIGQAKEADRQGQ